MFECVCVGGGGYRTSYYNIIGNFCKFTAFNRSSIEYSGQPWYFKQIILKQSSWTLNHRNNRTDFSKKWLHAIITSDQFQKWALRSPRSRGTEKNVFCTVAIAHFFYLTERGWLLEWMLVNRLNNIFFYYLQYHHIITTWIWPTPFSVYSYAVLFLSQRRELKGEKCQKQGDLSPGKYWVETVNLSMEVWCMQK